MVSKMVHTSMQYNIVTTKNQHYLDTREMFWQGTERVHDDIVAASMRNYYIMTCNSNTVYIVYESSWFVCCRTDVPWNRSLSGEITIQPFKSTCLHSGLDYPIGPLGTGPGLRAFRGLQALDNISTIAKTHIISPKNLLEQYTFWLVSFVPFDCWFWCCNQISLKSAYQN